MAGFGAKVKLSVDTSASAKSSFNAQIKTLVEGCEASKIDISKSLTVTKAGLDGLNSDIQEKIGKKNFKIESLKVEKIDCSAAITDLKAQLQGMINSLSIKNGVSITGLAAPTGTGSIETDVKRATAALAEGSDEANNFNARLKVLKETMGALSQAYKSAMPGKRGAITDTSELDTIIKRYTELQAKIAAVETGKKAGKVYDTSYMQSLQEEAVAIQASIASIRQKQQADAEAAEAAERAAKAKRDDAAASRAAADAAEASAQKETENTKKVKERIAVLREAATLRDTLNKNITNWTAAKNGPTADAYNSLVRYRDDLNNLITAYKTGALDVDSFKTAISNLKVEVQESSIVIKNANKDTKTFGDRVGSLAKKFSSWLTISQIIMALYRAAKQMATAVKEIDTAMTELRKVTDETNASYAKFLDNAVARAEKLGATISDVVSASADFARLGYALEDASSLADAAIVYKNVGDGINDITDASESIISTMQAFGVSAEDAMKIVDKFNEVGNNFAISSKGVGDALLRSASAMASANNTLDETIALITAANTVVQDPDKVGTALKTVSMFLRAAKTEAEEAGESTDGMAESVSALRHEILTLTGGKVDIQIDENTFKSTYEIIRDLSKVWGDLTDISQANILEMIGGKRNSNITSALIENFSVAEEVFKASADSAGSALAENEKYLESINGKIAQFKASFQELSETLVGSDLVKVFVELGTFIMNALNGVASLIEKLGGLKTVLLTIGGILAIKNAESIFSSFLRTGRSLIDFGADAINIFSKLPTAFRVLKNGAAGATTTLSKTTMSLWSLGIAATSAQVAMAAIVAVIAAVAIGIAIHNRNIEKSIEKANEIADAYTDAQSTFNSNIKTLQSLKERYTELAKGVDDAGRNVGLTASEYDEFLSICNQIAEISPSVVDSYDSEGNAILNYRDAIDKAIESQNEYLENERQIYLGSGNDLYKGKKNEYSQYLSELREGGRAVGSKLMFENVEAYRDAVEYALEAIGLDMSGLFDEGRVGSLATWVFSDLEGLYEKRDAFINALRKTNAYAEEELIEIELLLGAMGNAYENMASTEAEQVDWLLEKLKSRSEEGSKWYEELIPSGAQDEFYDALIEINDPLKSASENLLAAEEFGEKFANAFSNEKVRQIVEMSQGLSDGTASIEEYDAAVNELADSGELDSSILPTMLAYFNELSDGYIRLGSVANTPLIAAEAMKNAIAQTSESIDTLQTKISSLSDAYIKLNEGTLGVGDVIDLIQQFPELAGYVDLADESFGDLDEGIRKVVKNAPDKLIETLQKFKETNNLTDDAANSIDALCESLENIPLAAISDIGEEFGVVGDSIRAANKALAALKAGLEEDDYDTNYNARIENLAAFKEALAAGEVGSRHYQALAEYYGLLEESPEYISRWIKNNEKYFTEGTAGLDAWLATIAEMGKDGGPLDGIASYADGQFWYNAMRLEDFARELDWTEEMVQDMINKFRMYSEDFGRENEAYFNEFLNEGVLTETADGYIAAIERIMQVTGRAENDAIALIDKINQYLAENGQATITLFSEEKIEAIKSVAEKTLSEIRDKFSEFDIPLTFDEDSGAATVTQGTVDSLLSLKMTGEEVIALLDTLASHEDISIDTGLNVDGVTYEKTANDIEAIENSDPEVKVKTNFHEVQELADAFLDTLGHIPGEYPVSIPVSVDINGNSAVFSPTNPSNVPGAYKSQDPVVAALVDSTLDNLGIDHNAKGTKHASPGLSLLGDEYSPDGTPKPELVVSGDQAYLAGVNGPTLGYLEDGDRVYTASETKEILGGRSVGDFIKFPAFSEGEDGDSSIEGIVEDLIESAVEDKLGDLKLPVFIGGSYSPTPAGTPAGTPSGGNQPATSKEVEKKLEKELNSLKDVLEETLGDFEHSIFLEEHGRNNIGTIIETYKKMQTEISILANKYREMGLSEESDHIQDLQKQWWEYQDSIDSIKEQAVADVLEMADSTNELVDAIQSVSDTLHKAADEYAQNGGNISVDTFQEIMELGPEYLQYLKDENGLLKINEDAINKVIAARTEQLAVETALSYVKRLGMALNGESNEDLGELLGLTAATTDATWELVYANLKLLGLSDSQYAAAAKVLDNIRALSANTVEGIKQGVSSIEEMQEGLDGIIDYTMDMLKDKIEEQIDALEAEKDAYADIIQSRKKSLELAKEEGKYQDEVADKVKTLAEYEERLALLALDDSREAAAERAKIQSEMADAQKDLADYQADHANEKQIESLDDMQASYDAQKDEEIRVLEESISSTQKLYDMAIDYIRNNWSSLKDQLIEWNHDIGNNLKEEIMAAWDACSLAAENFGGIDGAIDALTGANSTSGKGVNTVVSNAVDGMEVDKIAEMKANSAAWNDADAEGRKELAARNEEIAKEIAQLIGKEVTRNEHTGIWYVGDEELYKLFESHHTGGVAGMAPTLKQNEVLSVLEDGELILDEKKEQGLFRVIDFVSDLSERLGTVINTADLSSLFSGTRNMLNRINPLVPSGIASNGSSIHFGDVYIYGANESTIEEHRKINRQFANDLLKQLNIKK